MSEKSTPSSLLVVEEASSALSLSFSPSPSICSSLSTDHAAISLPHRQSPPLRRIFFASRRRSHRRRNVVVGEARNSHHRTLVRDVDVQQLLQQQHDSQALELGRQGALDLSRPLRQRRLHCLPYVHPSPTPHRRNSTDPLLLLFAVIAGTTCSGWSSTTFAASRTTFADTNAWCTVGCAGDATLACGMGSGAIGLLYTRP